MIFHGIKSHNYSQGIYLRTNPYCLTEHVISNLTLHKAIVYI